MRSSPFKLEVCIDTAQGMEACQKGVDTIELCSALALGGLTPSAGLIALARNSAVPIHAMIRPRMGDFMYSPQDVEVMLADISLCSSAQFAGIVVGASTSDGTLDLPILRQMADAAVGQKLTLHRVIDTLFDPFVALEQAIDLGFSRILTSGGHPVALNGTNVLKRMIEAAGDRIEIVVGSGVNSGNVTLLRQETGARSFHASCRRVVPQSEVNERFGFAPKHILETDPRTIADLRRRLNSLS